MPAFQTDHRNRIDSLVVAAAQQMPDALEVHRVGQNIFRHHYLVLVSEAFFKLGLNVLVKAFNSRWPSTQDRCEFEGLEVTGSSGAAVEFATSLTQDTASVSLWWRDGLNEDDKLVIEHLYQIPALMQLIRQNKPEKEQPFYLSVLDPTDYMVAVGQVKDAWELLSRSMKGKDRPWSWLCTKFHPSMPFTEGVEIVRNVRPKYRYLYAPTSPLHPMFIEQSAWDDFDVIAFSMPVLHSWRDELVRTGEKITDLVGYVFDLSTAASPRSLRESLRGKALIETAKQANVRPFMTGVVTRKDALSLLEKNETTEDLLILSPSSSPSRSKVSEALAGLTYEPSRLPVLVAFKGALSLHAMPVSPIVSALTN